jgi:beta-glucosidase
VAHHLRVFAPGRDRLTDKWICALFDRLFHQFFITGMSEGRLLFPVGRGYPFGRGNFQDFFGINYYSRDMLYFKPGNIGQLFGERKTNPDAARNDLGWEIYPQGLYDLCRKYFNRFAQPIYILENGTCDGTDAFRGRYIYDHLQQVKRLIQDGIDIQRYYHWTLMDNFEWAEGLSARFGLVEVNYDTQQRSIRNSGHFYSDICRQRRITEEMISRYIGRDE